MRKEKTNKEKISKQILILGLYMTLLQVHVHLKRHSMKELPETDDAVAQWCKDIFVAKVIHRGHI